MKRRPYEVTFVIEVRAGNDEDAIDTALDRIGRGGAHYVNVEEIEYDDCDAAYERSVGK